MNIIKFNQMLFKKPSDFTPGFVKSSISMKDLLEKEVVKDEHLFFTLADLDPKNSYRFNKRMNYDWAKKTIVFLDFRVNPYFVYEFKIDDLFGLDSVLETLSSGNSLQLDILDSVIFS